MNFSTHIMDEFSLQETDRFQCQEVVHQEGVGVFQSTDNTPEDEADACIHVLRIDAATNDKSRTFVYLWASTRACEALSSV